MVITFSCFIVIFALGCNNIRGMKAMEREQSFMFGVSVSDYNFIGRKSEIRQLKMNLRKVSTAPLFRPYSDQITTLHGDIVV